MCSSNVIIIVRSHRMVWNAFQLPHIVFTLNFTFIRQLLVPRFFYDEGNINAQMSVNASLTKLSIPIPLPMHANLLCCLILLEKNLVNILCCQSKLHMKFVNIW